MRVFSKRILALIVVSLIIMNLVPIYATENPVTIKEILEDISMDHDPILKEEYLMAKSNTDKQSLIKSDLKVTLQNGDTSHEIIIDEAYVNQVITSEKEKIRVIEAVSLTQKIGEDKENGIESFSKASFITFEIADIAPPKKTIKDKLLGLFSVKADYDEDYAWDGSYSVRAYVKGYFNRKTCGGVPMLTPYRVDGKIVQIADPTVDVDWLYHVCVGGFTWYNSSGFVSGAGQIFDQGSKYYNPNTGSTYVKYCPTFSGDYFNVNNGTDFVNFVVYWQMSRGSSTWTASVSENAD